MSSGSAEVYLQTGRAQAQPKNCANDAHDQGSGYRLAGAEVAASFLAGAEVAASSMSLAVSFA